MDTKGSPDTVQGKVYCSFKFMHYMYNKLKLFCNAHCKTIREKKNKRKEAASIDTGCSNTRFQCRPFAHRSVFKVRGRYSLDGLCEKALLEGIHFSGVGYRKR